MRFLWKTFCGCLCDENTCWNFLHSEFFCEEQARKPRSYASSKLSPTYLLTGVRCRATSVAKNWAIAIFPDDWRLSLRKMMWTQFNLKCGNPQQSPTFAFDLETNKLLSGIVLTWWWWRKWIMLRDDVTTILMITIFCRHLSSSRIISPGLEEKVKALWCIIYL